jgi:archaeosine synthase beta-subunit
MQTYPADPAARDRFVLDRRPPRATALDAWTSQGVVIEDERLGSGAIARVATVFLTGRECPWRCAMCDLWQHTRPDDTPPGAIAAQVADARLTIERSADRVDAMKLYNASSFFDPRAIPVQDYPSIADQVAGLARVIVESHPSLVGRRTREFQEALACRAEREVPPALEVAMGLETAHPQALDRLNKRMTVDALAAAADRLIALGAAIRVFLLVSPPFVPRAEQDEWLVRSVDAAFDCGAAVVSLIPTRTGNGAVEALAADALFTPPTLDDLERSFSLALPRRPSEDACVFADLWDLQRHAVCPHCLDARRARLHAMNLTQRVSALVSCAYCGAGQS